MTRLAAWPTFRTKTSTTKTSGVFTSSQRIRGVKGLPKAIQRALDVDDDFNHVDFDELPALINYIYENTPPGSEICKNFTQYCSERYHCDVLFRDAAECANPEAFLFDMLRHYGSHCSPA